MLGYRRLSIPSKVVALLLTTGTLILASANAVSTNPLTLDTDNGAVRIKITQDPPTVELKQPVKFTLDFLDPISNNSKSHVNYDFSIVDAQQNKISEITGLHTHEGHDIESTTFDIPGNYTLSVDVKGTGLNQPFDTSYSGLVTTNIVIP